MLLFTRTGPADLQASKVYPEGFARSCTHTASVYGTGSDNGPADEEELSLPPMEVSAVGRSSPECGELATYQRLSTSTANFVSCVTGGETYMRGREKCVAI